MQNLAINSMQFGNIMKIFNPRVRSILRKIGFAVCVAMYFVAIGIFLNRTVPGAWEAEAPSDGLSGCVSKYQVEFMKLRLILADARLRSKFSEKEILDQLSVLDGISEKMRSKSEATTLFKAQALSTAVAQIASLQTKIQNIFVHRNQSLNESLIFDAQMELESIDSSIALIGITVAEEERKRREADVKERNEGQSRDWKFAFVFSLPLILSLISSFISIKHKLRAQRAELKASQAEKQAIFEKEAALKERGHFLSSISHELGSQLQSIIGAIVLLKLDMDESDPRFEPLNRIDRGAQALKSQMGNLLILSRGEAGKLEIHPNPFEANDLIKDVANEFKANAVAKGLHYMVLLPKTDTYVIGDPNLIRQIISNVVSNAVKYTDKGSITLSLRPFEARRGYLSIAVNDTGRGIPSTQLDAIFNPYERLGITAARDGSGVGLSIVKTVSNLIGAKVTVNSVLGQGTQFAIEIPVKPLPAEKEASQDRYLLIVDDRPEILQSLVALAVRLNIKAEGATSAAEAANMLAAKKYYLVMLDLDLGDKGGRDVAAETRNGNGPNRETCIVAFSAADKLSLVKGWPFDGFIQKPIHPNAIQNLFNSPPIGIHLETSKPSSGPIRKDFELAPQS